MTAVAGGLRSASPAIWHTAFDRVQTAAAMALWFTGVGPEFCSEGERHGAAAGTLFRVGILTERPCTTGPLR